MCSILRVVKGIKLVLGNPHNLPSLSSTTNLSTWILTLSTHTMTTASLTTLLSSPYIIPSRDLLILSSFIAYLPLSGHLFSLLVQPPRRPLYIFPLSTSTFCWSDLLLSPVSIHTQIFPFKNYHFVKPFTHEHEATYERWGN